MVILMDFGQSAAICRSLLLIFAVVESELVFNFSTIESAIKFCII